MILSFAKWPRNFSQETSKSYLLKKDQRKFEHQQIMKDQNWKVWHKWVNNDHRTNANINLDEAVKASISESEIVLDHNNDVINEPA